MPQFKLVVKFLLVFALIGVSASPLVAQWGTLPQNTVAVSMTETAEGFMVEAQQVGSACVGNLEVSFGLLKLDLGGQYGWQTISLSPRVQMGNMENVHHLAYKFPARRTLYEFRLGINKTPGLYVLIPTWESQRPGACAPVILQDNPVLLVGNVESFPEELRGLGSYTRNVVRDVRANNLFFEVVGRNVTEVVVFQKVRMWDGREAVVQRTFEVGGYSSGATYVERLMVPLAQFFAGGRIDVRLRDKISGYSVTETLTGGAGQSGVVLVGPEGQPNSILEREGNPGYHRLFMGEEPAPPPITKE